jgi:hypothetical protein
MSAADDNKAIIGRRFTELPGVKAATSPSSTTSRR